MKCASCHTERKQAPRVWGALLRAAKAWAQDGLSGSDFERMLALTAQCPWPDDKTCAAWRYRMNAANAGTAPGPHTETR